MVRRRATQLSLGRVRNLVDDGRFAVTARVARYLTSRSWDTVYVGECLCALRTGDVHKSVSDDRRQCGQLEIYRPVIDGLRLYIKFTIDDAGDLYVLSFCRDGDSH